MKVYVVFETRRNGTIILGVFTDENKAAALASNQYAEDSGNYRSYVEKVLE